MNRTLCPDLFFGLGNFVLIIVLASVCRLGCGCYSSIYLMIMWSWFLIAEVSKVGFGVWRLPAWPRKNRRMAGFGEGLVWSKAWSAVYRLPYSEYKGGMQSTRGKFVGMLTLLSTSAFLSVANICS